MDSLSEVLRMIHLRGIVYFERDFASSWGMDVPRSPVAAFHLVTGGSCWLVVEGLEKPVQLNSGDLVVFPFGKPHTLGDDPATEGLPGSKIVEAHQNGEPIFSDGPVNTKLLCGHFSFDRDLPHPFLESLPGMIHLTGFDRREVDWFETVIRAIVRETDSGKPGAVVITERLSEILFIQIIRACITREDNAVKYLAAFNDRRVSDALGLIHTKPGRRWTLETLAREVGMSRTAFANRFRDVVGETPMHYLARWRMLAAKELLSDRSLSTLEIAERVGYTSEVSFGKVFRKFFDASPGVVRRRIG